MKASRSPSPSRSAKTGVALYPTSVRPKGSAEEAKAGAEEEPVFSKKIVFPRLLPMKASRSPSPSRSAKAGEALPPTLARPKRLAKGKAKAGAEEEPVFSKKIVFPRLL